MLNITQIRNRIIEILPSSSGGVPRTNIQSYNSHNNRQFIGQIDGNYNAIKRETLTLIAPIFKINNWDFSYDTAVLENDQDIIETLRPALRHIGPTNKTIYTSMILVNNINIAKEIMQQEKENFDDLTSKPIQTVYKNMITSIENHAKALDDFAEIKIYKHKTSNNLIIISNYYITKAFRDTNGMKAVQNIEDINAHITIGLIPVLIPEFKNCLTEQELDIFKIYSNPTRVYKEKETVTAYSALLLSLKYEQYYRTIKINKLKQFLASRQQNVIEENIQNLETNIEAHVREIQTLEQRLVAFRKDLLYFVYTEHDFDILADYICNHPYIRTFNYTNDTLRLDIRLPLQQWDLELADILYKNLDKNNNISEAHKAHISKFMKNIMIDQKAKYIVAGILDLNLNSFEHRMRKIHDTFNREDIVHYLSEVEAGFNPHIENFQCVGSYASQIERAKQKKDLIGILECLLAPYKNWNLGDGAVSSRMFRENLPYFIDNKIHCIEYKDKMMTIVEFNNLIDEENNPKPILKPEIKKRTRTKKAVEFETTTVTFDQLATLADIAQVRENVQGVQGVQGPGPDPAGLRDPLLADDIRDAILQAEAELRTQAVDVNAEDRIDFERGALE